MKIKEIDRTAHIAWSPAVQHPIYLAAGTAAQQLDASFSTTANLELYSLDLGEPGPMMGLKASIPTKQRFHKLVWGSHGISSGALPSGVLVGGADQGHIMMFDAAKLLDGDASEYLLSETKKHTGPVKSLDFNPSQLNLLASGATDSEIYIWDLNSSSPTPMTPGSTSQPPDEVTCLAWNQKVQHILASTFSTRCVVWDLRKNEPIIKISDSTARCKSVAWHPEQPTQLCLASEDDRAPVVQLWDLRFATSPLKTFEGHQRGILSMAWCSQDPDLLMTCGKDNRVVIWNANSQQPNGEILSELSTSNQWCFDASWCPRNPSVIAAASFDGRIGVHSIMGGRELSLQPTSNMIADSFPGMEAPVGFDQQQQTVIIHQQLRKPPSWLRPLCGASFGFGGKLVSFGLEKNSTEKGKVHISQVVTEEDLVTRSKELETALQGGQLADLCASKAQQASDSTDRTTWEFLGANFSPSPRKQLLHLLGYELPDVSGVLEQATDQLSISDSEQSAETFDAIAAEATLLNIRTDDSVEGRISKALLTGDLKSAVDLCFVDKRYTDALVLAMTGPPELLNATRDRYFRVSQGDLPRLIQSVVTRNWQQIVQHCDLSNWKEALAATLTYADDHEFASLCQTIGQRLESESSSMDQAVLCYICAGKLEKLVDCWLLKNDNSTSALQELVEQVMVLRQAQQHLGRDASASVGSSGLTNQFCRYAGLLAGQGNLQTALTYVDLSQDASMTDLKERLQRALGQAQSLGAQRPAASGGAFVNGMPQRTGLPHLQQRHYSGTKPAAPANPYYSDPYNSPVQQMPTLNPARPSTPQQSWATGPSHYNPPAPSSYNPPAPSPYNPSTSSLYNPSASSAYNPSASYAPPAPTPTNYYNPPQAAAPPPPVAAPPPPAAAVAPPPPASGGGQQRSALSLSQQRNRVYVQDPSLFGGSAPRTVQSSYFNDTQFPTNTQFQPTTYSGTPFQPNPYQQTNQFNGQSAPMQQQQQQQQLQPQPPQQPQAQSYGAQSPPAVFQPTQFTAPPTPPLMNGSSATEQQPAIFNPVDHAPAPFAPPVAEPPAPLPSTTPPVVPVSNPPPGWNDPPTLTMVTKPKVEVPTVEPITHPLFGTAPVEQPQQPTLFNPTAGIMQPVPLDAQHPSDVAPAAVPQKVEPPPTVPLPAEHQIIHDVFYLLKDRCTNLANTAQMKRKLDDVNKKLECLDERLRNNALSSNTLHGLHQIIQATQSGDYASGLALHTQLVSGTNFTEIGSFMPGLKTLLQMSAQLGVQAH